MNIRKLLAMVLVLAMIVSMGAAFDLKVEASAAETAVEEKTDVVYDYIFDISQYRDADSNGEPDKTDISGKIGNFEEAEGNAHQGSLPDIP